MKRDVANMSWRFSNQCDIGSSNEMPIFNKSHSQFSLSFIGMIIGSNLLNELKKTPILTAQKMFSAEFHGYLDRI